MRRPLLEILALVLSGFFVGVLCMLVMARCWLGMPGLWDFAFFDLFKFVVTVFIAVYITYYLKNRYSDRQVEKKIMLDIADEIRQICEDKIEAFVEFMQKGDRCTEEKNRMLLLLKRISNKISILESQQDEFGSRVGTLIEALRVDYRTIKRVVTGDEKFVQTGAYSAREISGVMKLVYRMLFNIDQLKLTVFL